MSYLTLVPNPPTPPMTEEPPSPDELSELSDDDVTLQLLTWARPGCCRRGAPPAVPGRVRRAQGLVGHRQLVVRALALLAAGPGAEGRLREGPGSQSLARTPGDEDGVPGRAAVVHAGAGDH